MNFHELTHQQQLDVVIDLHQQRDHLERENAKQAELLNNLIEQQAERIKELEERNNVLHMTYTEAYNLLGSTQKELAALRQRIKELEAAMPLYDELLIRCAIAEKELASLRQRIDDAPVVAWEYALCSPNAVLDRQASHVNWDKRYQPFGRSGVDYATGARVQKRPLISKEDLK